MTLSRWLLLGLLLPGISAAQVAVLRVSPAEISSTRGERVTYALRTERPGSLIVNILTADRDVVRRLELGNVQAGEHQVAWDGKDDRGQPVPDEAYCVQAILESAGQRSVDDPCSRTGGEVLSDIQHAQSPNGDIAYTLVHPARVLIRVGIKGGAMLRSLAVWQPRPAGRNLQRWNWLDDSGQVDLRNERLSLLVTAFRLPDFTVITTGNAAADYRSYRLSRGWAEEPDPSVAGDAGRPLERNGQRIARQHYMARYKDRDPRITVTLARRDGTPLKSDEPLPEEVRVAVDLHPDDRWLMQESLYEVGFFVNGDFVSEEENGYVPIGWIWNTSRLATGRHLLTVNLTGFTGRVGAKTLAVVK